MNDKRKNDNEINLWELLNYVPNGIGIYEVREQSICQLYLNDGFYNMLGDTRENREPYSGTNFMNAVHPLDVPAMKQIVGQARSGASQVELTYRIIKPDKNYMWF